MQDWNGEGCPCPALIILDLAVMTHTVALTVLAELSPLLYCFTSGFSLRMFYRLQYIFKISKFSKILPKSLRGLSREN